MMKARRALAVNDLRWQPGLSRAARDSIVPTTVLQALRIHGVGRRTTKRLLMLGLLTDSDNVQGSALSLEACTGQEDRRALH